MKNKFGGLIIILFLLLSGMSAQSQKSQSINPGRYYQSFGEDGAWCWFSDPRAVFYKGKHERSYVGAVNSKGDITIAYYDHETKQKEEHVVFPQLQRDDHVNPSILFLPDGRLMLFFTKHNGGMYYTKSVKPEDISKWEEVQKLDMGRMLCYTNPVMLSEEDNRIYVFFRGGYDWKPSFVVSDDLGKTWSDPKTLVGKPGAEITNRPYTKLISDGKKRIYFAFTDGHPRNEPLNSIYCMYYEAGAYYQLDGTKLGEKEDLPIDQTKVQKVYDARETTVRSWIWDVAIDKNGYPVMVYTQLNEETDHKYFYASWNGEKWSNHKIANGGKDFPRKKRLKEARNPEPHYSGGIILDHTNPSVVYLSRPVKDVFEVFRYETNNGGKNWKAKAITSGSEKDNVRPYVTRNAPENLQTRLFWMQNNMYEHYSNYHSSIKMELKEEKVLAELTPEAIQNAMKAVADWQIVNFEKVKYHPLDWTNGTLHLGMMEWAQLSENEKYLNWLKDLGKKYRWQPYKHMYHADDVVVCQMYLDLYRLTKEKRMFNPTQARINWVIDNPSTSTLDLDYRKAETLERWSWCDALFMAPPVYAQMASITGEKKYLKFMHKEFMATYNYLYDQEEHLFYRDYRYFEKREANGEKIFWGRGNGWVMGGLVKILKELPAKYKYRLFYEELFQQMTEKIASLQDKNGYWHASLLDPESYPNPETSASGFYCYALAYGVNAGLLDEDKYQPIVAKSWQALVKAVHTDGKLDWVQPIGADPKNVTADMTEVYGVGAFLFAGCEVYKLVNRDLTEFNR